MYVHPTFQHLREISFSVTTPRTNRNNGCPWEGLQEKIAITSEEGFYLDNSEVNWSIKGRTGKILQSKDCDRNLAPWPIRRWPGSRTCLNCWWTVLGVFFSVTLKEGFPCKSARKKVTARRRRGHRNQTYSHRTVFSQLITFLRAVSTNWWNWA